MSLNSLKSLLLELEQNIQTHLAQINTIPATFEGEDLSNLFDSHLRTAKQSQLKAKKTFRI